MTQQRPTNTLVFEVFRLNGRLIAAGDALVGDIGLTSARWQIMGAIAHSPVPLSVAQVARNMSLTRQAVQRVVNEMIAAALVITVPNPHHRRARLLQFTDTGRAAFDVALERWARFDAQIEALVGADALLRAASDMRRVREFLESTTAETRDDD